MKMDQTVEFRMINTEKLTSKTEFVAISDFVFVSKAVDSYSSVMCNNVIILKQSISDINQTSSQGFVLFESFLSVFSKKRYWHCYYHT